jgi:hypothetical protein
MTDINDGWSMTAFKPGEYKLLLSAMLDRGYSAVPLDAINSSSKVMFLRHDIDLCPARALAMARQEAELGLTATYYFLVSTQLYSIATKSVRSVLSEIRAMGHEIGLHFDAAQYSFEGGNLDDHAAEECQILEACSGSSVKSISFHRPTPEFLNRAGTIAGRRHCYEPSFFSDIAYLSDSNGGWHHGHPLGHPAIAAGKAIQLLTHPIWWVNAHPISTIATMRELHMELRGRLHSDLTATVSAYRDDQLERDI